VGATALAAGDPAAARVFREGRNWHRIAPRRIAPRRIAPHRIAPHRIAPHRIAPHRIAPRRDSSAGRRGGHEVHRLVEQQHAAGALVGGLWRRPASVFLVVPEHDRDVHIAGPKHPQGLRRLGLGQHELQARRLAREPGCGRRDQRAQRGRERGESHPAASEPDVRSQLSLGGVQPADDLLGALGQQLARLRQSDTAPDALQELGAGLRLKPGDVMTDGWLRVVQRTGGGGNRAVARDRDQHPQPGHIQHCSTIDRVDMSAAGLLDGVSVRLDRVGAPGWGGPAQDAGLGLLEFPAWQLLDLVVGAAASTEVACARATPEMPGDGVVKVGSPGRLAARREGARGVTRDHELAQPWGWPVGGSSRQVGAAIGGSFTWPAGPRSGCCPRCGAEQRCAQATGAEALIRLDLARGNRYSQAADDRGSRRTGPNLIGQTTARADTLDGQGVAVIVSEDDAPLGG
jgi:hypothetical protein